MWDETYFGNTVGQWSIAAGMLLGVLILGLVLRAIVRRYSENDEAPLFLQILGHLVARIRFLFLLILGVYLAVRLSKLSLLGYELDHPWLGHGFAVVFFVQCGLMATGLVRLYLRRYRLRKQREEEMAIVSALNFVDLGARALIWLIVILLIIDSFNYDVTALVAGLGVGGVAVALAVQNILGDVFASLTIVLDKPFVVGDFIIVGDLLGTVEHIGLKTTRIRSLSGEQLIFGNGDLLSSRIRNFKRMQERRVVFSLGVVYQTKPEKLRKAVEIIRETIQAQDKVRFDRSHFQKYGDFALIFENVYWVLTPDYNVYMDIQQAINLKLYDRFEAEGIEFAYPTQTLFVQHESLAGEESLEAESKASDSSDSTRDGAENASSSAKVDGAKG